MAFLVRCWIAFVIHLVVIDQAVQVVIRTPFYIVGLAETLNPDDTISSVVGKAAIANKKWALIAEKVINALFFFDPNHCRRVAEHDEL